MHAYEKPLKRSVSLDPPEQAWSLQPTLSAHKRGHAPPILDGYQPRVRLEAAKLNNLVARKFEVGVIADHYDFWRQIRNMNVLYSDPMEANFPVSGELFEQQWSGTSGYEIFGAELPKLFGLLR